VVRGDGGVAGQRAIAGWRCGEASGGAGGGGLPGGGSGRQEQRRGGRKKMRRVTHDRGTLSIYAYPEILLSIPSLF
jgi:hypothetical protein